MIGNFFPSCLTSPQIEGSPLSTICRGALSVRSLSLFERDADLGEFGARRQDHDRLPVAARRHGQIRVEYQALDDGLDLATIAFGTTLNRAVDIASRLAPISRDGSAVVYDVGGKVEIEGVAGASQSQTQAHGAGKRVRGAATNALAGAVGFLDGAGARPRALQGRERARFGSALRGARYCHDEQHGGDRRNFGCRNQCAGSHGTNSRIHSKPPVRLDAADMRSNPRRCYVW